MSPRKTATPTKAEADAVLREIRGLPHYGRVPHSSAPITPNAKWIVWCDFPACGFRRDSAATSAQEALDEARSDHEKRHGEYLHYDAHDYSEHPLQKAAR